MPDLVLENQFLASGRGSVIGIDEAGRGPWAGPVTAAAFWLNPDHYDALPDDLDDSKKLSKSKRGRIYARLINSQHDFAVVSASSARVDEMGILKATFWAMQQAASQLQDRLRQRGLAVVGLCLVDGNLTPDLGMPAKAIVKGDMRSCSIAAASIIAKETRDAFMCDLAQEYPAYGWQTNMGYGTKDHVAALAKHGVTRHHRRSFAPIKRLLDA
jgi:ribonuclease HII